MYRAGPASCSPPRVLHCFMIDAFNASSTAQTSCAPRLCTRPTPTSRDRQERLLSPVTALTNLPPVIPCCPTPCLQLADIAVTNLVRSSSNWSSSMIGPMLVPIMIPTQAYSTMSTLKRRDADQSRIAGVRKCSQSDGVHMGRIP